jgi:hypothetical protein
MDGWRTRTTTTTGGKDGRALSRKGRAGPSKTAAALRTSDTLASSNVRCLLVPVPAISPAARAGELSDRVACPRRRQQLARRVLMGAAVAVLCAYLDWEDVAGSTTPH